MSQETQSPSPVPVKRRRRWWRRLLYGCGLLLLLLFWLNGPGIRWLMPKVASYFLQKKGIVTSFEVEGSVLGGLSIHRLDLFGGPLVTLKIRELRPDYHWRELIDGKVRGIVIHDIAAELDLSRKFPGTEEVAPEPSQPFDLAKLIDTIRQQREKVLGYSVDITTQEILVRRADELVASVAPSALRHQAGSAEFLLSVGEIGVTGERKFPAQENQLIWEQDRISLDQLGLDYDLRVREFSLTTPADLRPSLAMIIDVQDTTFAVEGSENFERISLQLREGELDFTKLAEWLGQKSPVAGKLTSFDALVMPKHLPIHGKVELPVLSDLSLRLKLVDVLYEKHRVDECAIELVKQGANAILTVKADAMDAQPQLRIEQRWDQDPSDGEMAKRFSADVNLEVPELKPLLLVLRRQLGMDQKAVHPPDASLLVKGNMRMNGDAIGPILADVSLRPGDASIPAISLHAEMPNLDAVTGRCEIEGMTIAGDYRMATKQYEGRANLTDFDPHRLSPWLAWASITVPEGMSGKLTWNGKGDLLGATHQGSAKIDSFTWKRAESDDLLVDGAVSYDWPARAELVGLRARMGSQEAQFDAQFAEQVLTVSRLGLSDSGKSLISGNARIPVPEAMKSSADFLEQSQALQVNLQTEVLPLNTFDRWLPKDQPLPVKGSLKLDLQITGSPAEPLISGDLAVKNVKSLARDDLPPLDVMINLATVKRELQLTGQLLTPRTAPVSLRAQMPFRPGAWAKEPELVSNELLKADVVIPRWDLSRFQDLVPQVKDLAGELDGAITVTGKLSAPDIRGRMDLTKFQLTLPNEKVPPIRDASLRMTFADRVATLTALRAQLAGGDLQASGTMKLPATGQPVLDFLLKGNALPLWRDTAVIARANAEIRVAGPWDAVKISGPIRIVDSLLYKDFEIIPIGKPFTLPQAASLPALDSKLDAKAATMPAPFGNWTLDVSLQTQDPFLIRGNLARGSITMDLKVGGTVGNPQPLGKAIIQELTAALPLSKLNISSGTVSLTPSTGMDPQLDIRGTSRVSNYDVNIYVYGAVSAPKLLLTSEPPLPENEIMTLLATGTTTAGLTDASTAQSKGTQLLIEEFRRGRLPMGRRLLPLLSKLENVEIAVGEPDPYSGKKRASAKMPVFSNYFLYGAVDGEGKTRTLFMFEWKFR